jgi:hypothetical protein
LQFGGGHFVEDVSYDNWVIAVGGGNQHIGDDVTVALLHDVIYVKDAEIRTMEQEIDGDALGLDKKRS